MDIEISDRQVKHLALAISLNDVLECIKDDYESYLLFLNEELENKEITDIEYYKELNLIQKLKAEIKKEETI